MWKDLVQFVIGLGLLWLALTPLAPELEHTVRIFSLLGVAGLLFFCWHLWEERRRD
jgi:hypothetical protein